MAFELEEPRNFADDEIVWRNAQFFAKLRIVFRIEKRFEGEAAEDFCVLLRPTDAGGEVLFFHRGGDDDEMSRGPGSLFFGGAKGKV